MLAAAADRVRGAEPMLVRGRVEALRGLTIEAVGLPGPAGGVGAIDGPRGPVLAQAIGFEGERTILMLLGSAGGVRIGDGVTLVDAAPHVDIGADMLGRVLDGLGRPIDGGAPIARAAPCPLRPPPVPALARRPIREAIETGVRVLDTLTTVGRGQRLGIFAGPGVGKSTLLGMIARGTAADVNVVAMIGERGREVQEFIEGALGAEGLARSVVVVATSDEPPPMRVRAAMVACAIAEWFRAAGRDVMLLLDSVTRFAQAQRQIGLMAGEPPTTRGYPPSVQHELAELLERAGALGGDPGGSITGFYTILVEGDDLTEPISDAVRGILDGHVVLSRSLAQEGHFPAVDPLDSVSRLADAITPPERVETRRAILRLLAAHRRVEELLRIGAYTPGGDPVTDAAIRLKPDLDAVLRQRGAGGAPAEEAWRELERIALVATTPAPTKTEAS